MELELGLKRSRLDQRHAFFSPAHRPRVDVFKMPVHPEGEEHVVGMPEAVEPRGQMAQIRALTQRDRLIGHEPRHHRERAQHVIRAFPHGAVGPHLKELPIEDDHLAVEVLKGA